MVFNEEWQIHPEVQRLYEKYRDEMSFWRPNVGYNNNKKFYVYKWITSDEEKVFYVGKGTGNRVKHILKEIEEYEKDNRKYKGERYKQLKDIHGIEYKIILDGLSDFEAQIYEFCMMREFTNNGEVLLNYADMPLTAENTNPIISPKIFKDKYFERYLNDYSIPTFDSINLEGLSQVYFYDALLPKGEFYDKRDKIISWIEASGGRIYSNKGKKVKSIIVFGLYPYEKYKEDHKDGKKVYSADEVMDFITRNKPIQNTIKKHKITVPKYDVAKREEMRDYIKSIENRVIEMAKTKGYGFEEQIKGYELKAEGNDKGALLYFYVAGKKGWDLPQLYLQHGIVLRKYGLFEEEVQLLKDAIKNCNFNDTCLASVSDRLKKAEAILKADNEN